MYKKRIITDRLIRLFKNFPVVAITGARQIGKSTLLEHIFPETEMVVFDPVVDIMNARKDPDFFLDNHKCPLILDEIQYAPELVAAIKRRVDKTRQPGQYILTGSQQWAVMKNISESLAGRALFVDMESFSLAEICQNIPKQSWLERWLKGDIENFQRLECTRTVAEQIWRGWLPKADQIDLEDIPTYYRSYLQTYIERDARMLADVNDWQQFGKFVQLTAALTAQEINYSQMGQKVGMSYQTAERWLMVLKATFQWYEVPAFSSNTIKKIRSKPKGYISDTGLACSLNMISSHKALMGHPMMGAFFETAVASEIRKMSYAMNTQPQMYHWRSYGGAEVDLILEMDGMLFPIEVKLTSNPARRDTVGISAFRKTYPNHKIASGLVICPCEKFIKISEQDYALPWDTL